MILLILFEKSHKHAKINKFVRVSTFGEANLEIDIYMCVCVYIYISFNLDPSEQKFLILSLEMEANKFFILLKD